MLGVLTAIGAALRPLGAGVAGIETVFFLLVLAGRVYGPGFGFVLGTTTMFASALLTGGVGPWLPFQMLASGWVGLGAGLLPRRVQRTRRAGDARRVRCGERLRLRLRAQHVVLAVLDRRRHPAVLRRGRAGASRTCSASSCTRWPPPPSAGTLGRAITNVAAIVRARPDDAGRPAPGGPTGGVRRDGGVRACAGRIDAADRCARRRLRSASVIDPSAPPPRRLSDALAGLGRVVVAFSGGVDSSVLAHAALRELGPSQVLAVTAESASLATGELDHCRDLAATSGLPWRSVRPEELDDPRYLRQRSRPLCLVQDRARWTSWIHWPGSSTPPSCWA